MTSWEGRQRLEIKPRELRKRRLRAGLTQAQLASLAKMSTARINQLEAGDNNGKTPGITPQNAVALAARLRCDVTDITKIGKHKAKAKAKAS